jgi:hypothetical protein
MLLYLTVLFTFGLSKVYRDVLTIVAKVHTDVGCHQVPHQPKIKSYRRKVDAYYQPIGT